MFTVLFEVTPRPGLTEEYLGIAKLLRPELIAIDGFIDNVRYAVAGAPAGILSMSTWRDEKSLVRWRTHATHHEQGQRRGRFEIFAAYRLRIIEVTHDSDPPPCHAVTQQRFDATEVSDAKAVSIVDSADPAAASRLPDLAGRAGLTESVRCDGILEPHGPLLLASWTSLAAAAQGTPSPDQGLRVRHGRVIRDYGLHDRREAPQYFPAVP